MTLYLVRHASAGARDDHNPSDDRRPLDATGRLQADKLAGWLGGEPVKRLISSPFSRCVQTLEPLGALLGVEVETDDRLAEGTPVEVAWGLLEEHATGGAVFCSHGDVIPDLIRRAQLRGMEVPGRSGCSKGSVWTLTDWDGDRFLTGAYTPVKA